MPPVLGGIGGDPTPVGHYYRGAPSSSTGVGVSQVVWLTIPVCTWKDGGESQNPGRWCVYQGFLPLFSFMGM